MKYFAFYMIFSSSKDATVNIQIAVNSTSNFEIFQVVFELLFGIVDKIFVIFRL